MKQTSKRTIVSFLIVAMAVGPAAFFAQPSEAKTIRPIIFPVLGTSNFSNDWHAPRVGHLHQGNDVFGKKGMPLVSTVDGIVNFVPYPQPSYGYMVSIRDNDGYEYWYLHMNNDNPGTDDGQGGGMHAYAPGIEPGAKVKAGQLIGWLGDSGNAESTISHLHFELHEPDGDAINPFFTLSAAQRITKPVTPEPQINEIFPFSGFSGGVNIARGNVNPNFNGDELIVAVGAGGGPDVRVYSQDRTPLLNFFAYPSGFRGGIDVTAGDIDGDGVDEIITAAGRGGKGEVHIYSGQGELLRIFFPYPKFNGDVHIASADLDGDSIDEIIVGPGRGGGPEVRVLDGNGVLKSHFMAYPSTFRGGVDITAIDATEDTSGYIISVPLAGGGPHIKVFRADTSFVSQFFAYRKDYRGGVRLSSYRDVSDGSPVIVAVPGNDDNADIRLFGLDGTTLDAKTAYEEWWRGGYDIAAAADGSLSIGITSPNRRATVRTVINNDWWQQTELTNILGD